MLTEDARAIEDRLSTIGDDSRLAGLDLQNRLQRQQQTVAIMSVISKVTPDTAQSIIRNLGGYARVGR
jgi:hypothetical protein